MHKGRMHTTKCYCINGAICIAQKRARGSDGCSGAVRIIRLFVSVVEGSVQAVIDAKNIEARFNSGTLAAAWNGVSEGGFLKLKVTRKANQRKLIDFVHNHIEPSRRKGVYPRLKIQSSCHMRAPVRTSQCGNVMLEG